MLSEYFNLLLNYFVCFYASFTSDLQEQTALYTIASKFIIDQFILKFNPLAALMISIQLASILVISAVVFKSIKSSTRANKKIRIYTDVRMEEIEMVRITRRNSSIKLAADKLFTVKATNLDISDMLNAAYQLNQHPHLNKTKDNNNSIFKHDPAISQQILPKSDFNQYQKHSTSTSLLHTNKLTRDHHPCIS